MNIKLEHVPVGISVADNTALQIVALGREFHSDHVQLSEDLLELNVKE